LSVYIPNFFRQIDSIRTAGISIVRRNFQYRQTIVRAPKEAQPRRKRERPGVVARRGQRPAGPSGAAPITAEAATKRSVRRARPGPGRPTAGWLSLCCALFLVYLLAVFAMAYLLVAISF
jgi:hypothetical protein